MFVYLGNALYFQPYKVPLILRQKGSKKKYGIPTSLGKIIYSYFKLFSWLYVLIILIILIITVCTIIEKNEYGDEHKFITNITYDGPQIGLENYPLHIIEFGCYGCEETRKSFPIVRELLQTYHGKITYQFIHYSDEEDIQSKEIGEFIECVEKVHPETYWIIHGILRDSVKEITLVDLSEIIETFSLEEENIIACLEANIGKNSLEKQENIRIQSGVKKIPTFFVNGVMVEKPQKIADLMKYIPT